MIALLALGVAAHAALLFAWSAAAGGQRWWGRLTVVLVVEHVAFAVATVVADAYALAALTAVDAAVFVLAWWTTPTTGVRA